MVVAIKEEIVGKVYDSDDESEEEERSDEKEISEKEELTEEEIHVKWKEFIYMIRGKIKEIKDLKRSTKKTYFRIIAQVTKMGNFICIDDLKDIERLTLYIRVTCVKRSRYSFSIRTLMRDYNAFIKLFPLLGLESYLCELEEAKQENKESHEKFESMHW